MSLFSRIPAVEPVEAHERADAVLLLDVREPAEWASGHAPDALHVPLGQLRAEDLPEADAVFVICRSGNRSGRATKDLRAAGVEASNVTGGMIAWARAGLPVV
jgi:rhodanese-related sulfurtransferase